MFKYMALTPEQLAQYRQKYNVGVTPTVTPGTPGQPSGVLTLEDRLASIDAVAKNTVKPSNIVEQVKPSLPPKDFTPLGTSTAGAVTSGIAKGGYQVLKETMNLGEMALKEKAKQSIPFYPAIDTLVKKTTGKDIRSYLPKKTYAETIQSAVEKKKGLPEGSLLKPINAKEKIAKGATELAAMFAPLPGAKTSAVGFAKKEAINLLEKKGAKSALDLSAEELNRINGKKLEYLSKDKLKELAKISGSKLTGFKYNVGEKIKPLKEEFSHILTSSKPEENLNAVRKYMKDTYNSSLNLFKGKEKAMNEKTVKNKLQQAIKNDPNAVYGKDLKEVSDKTINGFLKYVKKGTNKGLEEARNAWYQANKRVSDNKLSSANEAVHKAIKEMIKGTLTREEALAYDKAKQSIARINDVKEILKAKVAQKVNYKPLISKAGNIAKKALPWVGAGVLGKNIID